jgi:hypothetical protein
MAKKMIPMWKRLIVLSPLSLSARGFGMICNRKVEETGTLYYQNRQNISCHVHPLVGLSEI